MANTELNKPYIAISELTNTIYVVDGKEKYDVTEQAIKAVEAIEALKQSDVAESTTSDCISRQGVLEEVIRFSTEEGASVECSQLYCDVNNMPSVNPQEPRKGDWLRMSDLSEQEDDRYKCSHCGNVIHHKNKMDLYTYNSWCGRCGSDNGRHINYEVEQ